MGRLNRTNIPQLDHRRTSNLDRFREKEDLLKQRQKRNFDRRHIAKSLDLLEKGDKAWISDMKKYGEIVSTAAHPRSYNVDTEEESSAGIAHILLWLTDVRVSALKKMRKMRTSPPNPQPIPESTSPPKTSPTA